MAQKPVLIVLAGGVSSRMWPLREKSLLKFGEEPLLVSQLQRYRKLGLERVILIANPANQTIISELVEPLKKHMRIDVGVQAEPTGMGDALLQAEPFLGDSPDTPIYVTQVHDVVDDALHESMLKAFDKTPYASFLAGYEMADYFPGGYLTIDDDGRIHGIVEKPGAENRPSNLVNIVAHIHSAANRLFDAIRTEYASDTPGDDHYERAMAALMPEQVYQVVPYSGHWSALKFPWHVLDVMDHFLSRIEGQLVAEDAFIAPNTTLVGNVFIAPGARIYPGAAVVGPAYIGAGTIIGNNALVRNSMVLDNCEVGFTTEVARSYVADNCSMHACRVLDSIFAPGVNFSAGCTTANLRIDRGEVSSTIKGQRLPSGRNKLGAIIGQESFLSVDVMTMPGVKIGERAQVGPGTHVHHDIKDGQRVYVRQQLQVVDDAD